MFILVPHIETIIKIIISYFSYLFKGFFSDPKNVPGLAHFLEHLLFMGTSKYPKENEYSQVRTRHNITTVHIIIIISIYLKILVLRMLSLARNTRIISLMFHLMPFTVHWIVSLNSSFLRCLILPELKEK